MSSPTIAEIETIGDNATHLKNLRDCMRTTGGAIPFVGAGMSRNARYPGWQEFLELVAPGWGVKTEVENLLAEFRFEEAAEVLIAARSEQHLHVKIDDIFGEERLKKNTLDSVLMLLPEIFDGIVVTTNYDRVLEAAYRQRQCSFNENVLWGPYVDSFHKAVGTGQCVLFKVHGDATDRRNQILSLDDYESAYGVDANLPNMELPLPRLLANVFGTSRPVIFLGCSLTKDRTMNVLQSVYKRLGTTHYAVLELPIGEDERHKRERFLVEYGIFPIWYPTGHHDSIETILQSLPKSDRYKRAGKLVHVFTYSKKGFEGTEERVDYELDLRDTFQHTSGEDGGSCTVDSNAWMSELMPKLLELDRHLGASPNSSIVRANGNACHAVWLALGYVLRNVKRYRLLLVKDETVWSSVAPKSNLTMDLYIPEAADDAPPFETLNEASHTMAVSINVTHNIANAVRNNARSLDEIPGRLVHLASSKGIGRVVDGENDAVALALSTQEKLAQLRGKYKVDKIIIYYCGPWQCACLLGHYFNALPTIQFMEHDKRVDSGAYVPSFTLSP